jgi:hypothetical protein
VNLGKKMPNDALEILCVSSDNLALPAIYRLLILHHCRSFTTDSENREV